MVKMKTKQVRVLPIHIRVFRGAKVSVEQIREQVALANRTWATCNIRFSISSIQAVVRPKELTQLTIPISDQMRRTASLERVTSGFLKGVLIFYTNLSFTKESKANGVTFGRIYTPNNASPFLGVNIFFDNTLNSSNPNEGISYLLAHELGHALFVNKNAANIPQPEPQYREFNDKGQVIKHDPFHSGDPLNVMFPEVRAKPSVLPRQCEIARSSPLFLSSNISKRKFAQ